MRPETIKNVLLDLDGTLTDPADGMVKSFHYALERMDVPPPTVPELHSHIGPPLRDTFSQILKSTDRQLIERAVVLYRERYTSLGMFENEVYAGVPSMLASLRASGRRLFLATSKVTAYAETILEHFRLAEYFERIYGSRPEGELADKGELIAHIVSGESLVPGETVMVGDRKYDVAGARANGCVALGITYGYGSEEELRAAGADLICHTPGEVAERLVSGRRPLESAPTKL